MAALFPHWQAKGLLGRGGMGAVYHFYQPDLDRDVAVKLLPIEASADERQVQRFRREARALARLRHPNIVALHEAGITPAGHFFFVMEHVAGQPLSQIIASGKVSVPEAIEIIRQVCDALACAHAQGVIHRDIKPSNILINTDGRVKVADFGLARMDHAGSDDGLTLSHTGAFLGTPAYTAPEQARDAAHVDHRADLYSLGVLLYEMLTGELPRGVFQPPSRKAGSDARLDQVVQRALQERPEDRYQAADDLKNDVTCVQGSQERSVAAFPGPRSWRFAWAAVLVAALLMLVVLFSAGRLPLPSVSPWVETPGQAGPLEMRTPAPPPEPEPQRVAKPSAEPPTMAATTVAAPEPASSAAPTAPQAITDQPAQVQVWSLEPVSPALHPPASLLQRAWQDAFFFATGGAVLLADGSVVMWHEASPGKESPLSLPRPVKQLTGDATRAMALAEDGTALLLPSAPGEAVRELTQAEFQTLREAAKKARQSLLQISPPGLDPDGTVFVGAGMAVSHGADGKAVLWGPNVSDSPQRFRLPEGVKNLRLGPSGLMAAW
jgi:serine/threonine protein kinase